MGYLQIPISIPYETLEINYIGEHPDNHNLDSISFNANDYWIIVGFYNIN